MDKLNSYSTKDTESTQSTFAEVEGPLTLIEVLRPKPMPFPLIRIGANKDGAYLLPDDLKGIRACFSPGVNNFKDFEDELFNRFGIVSHMCDFSSDVEKLKTPLKPGQTFKKKWLDVNGDKDSITLSDWVNELEPNNSDDLLLQMDIEGAEYRNLLNAPDAVLRRFRIVVMELHRLSIVNRPEEFQKELGPLLAVLNKHFVCVHSHPNNCAGDVTLVGSNLNVPKVLELTFLRRDRLDGVKQSDCLEPLLPHPLDVSQNVLKRPPMFLNEHWLASGKRAHESTIKLLSDQVSYLSKTLSQTELALAAVDNHELHVDLFRLARYAASNLPAIPPQQTELIDLAKGKAFVLSSKHGAHPKKGMLIEKHPFFFHTGKGRNQFITIDLETESHLFELHITNRSDTYKERARFLFYCTHQEPTPNLEHGFPVEIDQSFLDKSGEVSVTKLSGRKARYLTIFTPDKTYLHFSAVRVFGLPTIPSE
jgi:hypothetical protein